MPRGVLELPTGRFLLTDHALQRAVEMNLKPDDIRAALENPRRTSPSKHHPGCRVFYHDRFMAAVDLSVRPHVVKTFLWCRQRDWKVHPRNDNTN